MLFPVSGTWTGGHVLMLLRAWSVSSNLWFSPDLKNRNSSVTSILKQTFACDGINPLAYSDVVVGYSYTCDKSINRFIDKSINR
jgi:hypothetical protein